MFRCCLGRGAYARAPSEPSEDANASEERIYVLENEAAQDTSFPAINASAMPPYDAEPDAVIVPLLEPQSPCAYCGEMPDAGAEHAARPLFEWMLLPGDAVVRVCGCAGLHVRCLIGYIQSLGIDEARTCPSCRTEWELPRGRIFDTDASDVVLPADIDEGAATAAGVIGSWQRSVPALPGRPWRGISVPRGILRLVPLDGAPQLPPDFHTRIDATLTHIGGLVETIDAIPWTVVDALTQ